jgi:hypothetical protein
MNRDVSEVDVLRPGVGLARDVHVPDRPFAVDGSDVPRLRGDVDAIGHLLTRVLAGLFGFVWRNPAVLINTPAAMTATNTSEMNTIGVPIPT